MIEVYKLITGKEQSSPGQFFTPAGAHYKLRGHNKKLTKARPRLDIRKYFFSQGLQVLERARPRTRSASLRVNHGGVAIAAAVPGVRMSAVTLNGGQHVYSSEHPCARLVVRGSACTVLLVYRPGSVAVDSMFYDEFSSLLDELVTRSEPLSDRGRRLQHQTRST